MMTWSLRTRRKRENQIKEFIESIGISSDNKNKGKSIDFLQSDDKNKNDKILKKQNEMYNKHNSKHLEKQRQEKEKIESMEHRKKAMMEHQKKIREALKSNDDDDRYNKPRKTVKEKEKAKRMKGQSSHHSWKPETFMLLRQQFD